MASSTKLTTTVSTKGQVILPKAVRQRLQWQPGTRPTVEDTADGVVLRAAPVFPLTSPDEVFASLLQDGSPKTLEEMDAAIAGEAKRTHRQSRTKSESSLLLRSETAQ